VLLAWLGCARVCARIAGARVGQRLVLGAHDAARIADACRRTVARARPATRAVSVGAAEIVGSYVGALEQTSTVGKNMARDFESRGRVGYSRRRSLGVARAVV